MASQSNAPAAPPAPPSAPPPGRPAAGQDQKQSESENHNCPFYGRHLYLHNFHPPLGVLVPSGGNQCGLITDSHAACYREVRGEPVDWKGCRTVEAVRPPEVPTLMPAPAMEPLKVRFPDFESYRDHCWENADSIYVRYQAATLALNAVPTEVAEDWIRWTWAQKKGVQ